MTSVSNDYGRLRERERQPTVVPYPGFLALTENIIGIGWTGSGIRHMRSRPCTRPILER